MADQRPPIARTYTPSALPSVTARVLAFVAIVLGGLCGALIGWAVTDLQCGAGERPAVSIEPGGNGSGGVTGGGQADGTGPDGAGRADDPAADDDGCTTWAGVGAVVGAVIGGGGVAVVAVLVLRAMAEWRRELEE